MSQKKEKKKNPVGSPKRVGEHKGLMDKAETEENMILSTFN